MNVAFFTTPSELRKWLDEHHTTANELWIGFWRKDSERVGLTYSEALDEALCYGWIDGVRKKVDALSYTNRFTRRKSRSHWSHVNLKRVEELIRQKRMAPPGLTAHAARDPENIGRASFEQGVVKLPLKLEKFFRAEKKAWDYFRQQAPSYCRVALWWITSAKRAETQLSRLEKLIAGSKSGKRLAMFTPSAKHRQTTVNQG